MSDSAVALSSSNAIAIGVVGSLLCAIVVALRSCKGRIQGAKLLKDDWLTVPTLVRMMKPNLGNQVWWITCIRS